MKIITPCASLDESKEFYSRIGFRQINEAPLQFQDAGLVVEIRSERTLRPGICIPVQDPKSFAEAQDLPLIETEIGFATADPNGVWVYLESTFAKASADEGNGNENENGNDGGEASDLGNFMGISIETMRFNESKTFYEALGLKVTMGAPEQGWIALTNEDGVGISLMTTLSCPHLFFNPSLTYFNSGKNPEIIAKLRSKGVKFAEEITIFNDKGEVDNVILRDPGGWGMFVFND